MSSGVGADRPRAELRALAHPVRLRILSLLTGSALTAAEVARELGLTHANASYHLRNLLAGGVIVPAGEERIRGGVAKRYRYDVEQYLAREASPLPGTRPADSEAFYAAVAHELRRRWAGRRWVPGNYLADAELWVDPQVWRDARDRIASAARDLHDAAQAPRSPGTVRTSTTVVLFEMKPGSGEPSRTNAPGLDEGELR
jgi:DNA-binding transcriptional ArsR family regulator